MPDETSPSQGNAPRDGSIHITGIHAENFRRLRIAKVEYVPERGLVCVTGLNKSGKTALLKAVAGALGGAGEVHEDSIREDAEKGWVRLPLSNGYTVERSHTEANPKGYLHVTGPDEGKHGQTKLDGWLGPRSFDPLAFFSLDADRQRDVLFSIGTDPDLPEKLKAVREKHQQVYEERTPIISRRRELSKVEEPEGERPEPVDTSEEMKRLRDLQEQERERGNARRVAEKARDDARAAIDAVDGAKDTVADLERRLAEAKQDLKRKQDEAESAKDLFEKKKAEYEALPDTSDAMDEIQDKLETAEERRAALEPWKRWESAQEEYEQLREQEKALTERLGALEQKEAALLEDAGIPIEGLGFDEDGEPLLNGRSLALASGAEKIELAVQVAIAADPDLRVCLLDEANDLDLDAMERLDELATAHDFQIFACRVGIEGPGDIVVDDGEAWGRNGPEGAEQTGPEESEVEEVHQAEPSEPVLEL